MGEMAFYYAACDVAVIGGSFAPLGGQNLIEALAAGAPVLVGPHMYNFAEATRLAVEAGAAIQVASASAAMARAGAAPRAARSSPRRGPEMRSRSRRGEPHLGRGRDSGPPRRTAKGEAMCGACPCRRSRRSTRASRGRRCAGSRAWSRRRAPVSTSR